MVILTVTIRVRVIIRETLGKGFERVINNLKETDIERILVRRTVMVKVMDMIWVNVLVFERIRISIKDYG